MKYFKIFKKFIEFFKKSGLFPEKIEFCETRKKGSEKYSPLPKKMFEPGKFLAQEIHLRETKR